ncbi:MAG TPA: glycosyltransferase family 4 protein [Patescibacteria group bacterium]|nr:glycosyltransferase family 4 protein [Patescibacteria group bacterium]
MKKVAIVTPFGAEERLDYFPEFVLARGLAARGFDIRFFTYHMRSHSGYRTDGIYKGVRAIRCSQWFGFSPKLIWELFRFRPEVVILGHVRSYLNFSASWAARRIGAEIIFQPFGFLHDPFIVADRDNPLETLYPNPHLIKRLGECVHSMLQTRSIGLSWQNYVFHAPLFSADRRVTISAFERDMLKKITGLESVAIPNGIPPHLVGESIQPKSQDDRALPSSYLFFIGQVKKRKGWDTILEALALLAKRGVRKNLMFATSSTPQTLEEAMRLANQLGIRDQIWFLQNVSNEEKNWLFTHAEAALAPSRYEGFGLPVVESWVAGTPVLGTDIPVYQDFLIDGVTGLVSKKGDPESLAENIARLEEPGLKEKIVAGGKEKMQEFTDERVVQQFLELFGELGV